MWDPIAAVKRGPKKSEKKGEKNGSEKEKKGVKDGMWEVVQMVQQGKRYPSV